MLKDELIKRIKTLQKKLEIENLDSYIVTSEDNIWYLTNITYKPEERPFFIIIQQKNKPILIVPKLEESHLNKIIIDCTILSYWEYPAGKGENWFDVLNDVTKHFERVGFETYIKVDLFDHIHVKEKVQIDLVDEMRKVKSEFELRQIIQTARYCDKGMGMIFESAYEGATVVEAFSLSRNIQTKLIQKKMFDPITTSLLTAVWPAPTSAMPHSIPNLSDRLGKGPNVAMSYFRINGYAAECERTFFLTSPNEEEREHFDNMMRARKLALNLIKPGMRASDIDTEVKYFLIKKGYAENMLHRVGHGIGLGNHEAPWVAEGSKDVLEENMLISVEPGLYFEGVGGYRHSDTVLITKNGCEFITQFPDDISSMTKTSFNISKIIKGIITQKILKLS